MIKDFTTKKGPADYLLALIVFGLVVFGLIMIYSSSVIISYEKVGHGYYYLTQQAISLAIGLALWAFFQSIDYHILKRFSFWLLVLSIILLILVFIPLLSGGGVHRWIVIGSFNFQPSEVVKLFLIIYLASWLADKKGEVQDLKKGFLPFLFLIILIASLIVLEPDLGTAAVLVLVGIVMFYLAGARLTHLLSMLIGGGGLLYLLIITVPYRLSRILTFLNPEASPMGSGYQLRNALIAIGSGGLLGLGFGSSSQKYLYLPEAHTDSIFAIISEELGFLRTILLIIAFIIIAWRGYRIAQSAPDRFGQLLAGGITTWLVFQGFVNIGAMLGLIPLTGLTLPFVSYGGTSLIVSIVGIGILLNISKFSQVVAQQRKKW